MQTRYWNCPTPRCSLTSLLIDCGLEASVPYDINAVSDIDKFSETENLRVMRPSIVLLNILGVEKENMSTKLRNIISELQDTGFILVVLDSASPSVIAKNAKTKLQELKNVEEYVFHPGDNSNHYLVC